MASKRAVTVLRPAVNGFGARALRAEWTHSIHNSTRTIASQVSRPRKLSQQPQQPQSVRFASSATAEEELGKTDLYELHSKYGAKFVPFGGYLMPVQYGDLSIIDSHKWTREKASLFDVGHM
jgi:aminomethyltransferase